MKLVPASIGAEPKKLAILGVLLATAGAVYFLNRDPSPAGAAASPRAPAPAVRPAPVKTSAARTAARPMEDFKPSLKPADGVDLSTVDPTLKLDLLAKVSGVGLDRGTRGSVFDWGQAPPAPPPVKIEPGKMAGIYGPLPPAPAPQPPAPPPAPAPPPIPLKFYGFSTRSGAKRAFFLDGDEIDVAGENEVIKNRYKVIRIGINSVEMEDLNFKHQQTLPLVAELNG